MGKVFSKGAVVLLVVGVLVIPVAAVASASAPQLWYLDFEPSAAGHEMEKLGGPGNDGQTLYVDILPNESVIWLADQPAVVDVTFAGGSWVVELKTDWDWGTDGDRCLARVGGWNIGGWYDIPTTEKVTAFLAGNILKILFQADPATVYQHDYLALEIMNNSLSIHRVYTDGRSSLRSPDTDPGYPLPELPTAILLGVGLVGLLGYLGLKRGKASTRV